MKEQEKMKQGYLWEDDEENMALQAHAKGLVRQFNSLPPESMDERAKLLKEIFGSVEKMYGLFRRLRRQSENMCRLARAPMPI